MTCTQVRIVTQHAKKTEDYLRLKQKSTMATFSFFKLLFKILFVVGMSNANFHL